MAVADPNLPPLPVPPSATTIAQIAGQARTLIAVIGGVLGTLGVAIPQITDAQLSNYVSAFLTVAGFAMWAWAAIWSWWQKNHQAKEARATAVAAAVASAHATQMAGTPTPVTVAPAPTLLNPAAVVATAVPHEEVMAAPRPPL